MLDENKKTKQVDVSIVIVSFNTSSLTRQCLESIQQHAKGIRYEVFVIDNASTDGSADMVAEAFPRVNLIRMHENKGFAGGNIPGMRKASGRYILLLNSDAFLAQDVLQDTLSHMDHHLGIGVLGCKLTNPDGSMQPSARMLPGLLNKTLHITGLAARFPKSKFFGRVDYTWWDHAEPKSVGWVVGAFFLIRAEIMADIGFLDERYFLYFEEIDYCLSARRAGWDVVFYPHARIVHLGGQSSVKTGQRVSVKGRQMTSIRVTSEFRYYRKMYGRFHVLASAAIEIIWNLVVIGKNMLIKSTESTYKIDEARTIIVLIAKTLWDDKLGRAPAQNRQNTSV